MELTYICGHIMRNIHAPVRHYHTGEDLALIQYYGDMQEEDPVVSNPELEQELLALGNEEHPVLFQSKYPIFYGVLKTGAESFIVGPICVEKRKVNSVAFCDYVRFCEEILLLFHTLTGSDMTCYQLCQLNHMTQDMMEKMEKETGMLIFHYQEHSSVHNSYEHERREMDSIEKGDLESLYRCMDEDVMGEYAILSKRSTLQAQKNLAIVAIALCARAAIRGGIPYEVAFSVNDSYILKVDESVSLDEISVLVGQCKIQYAEMVSELRKRNIEQNTLIERCKNLIFKKMHSRIVVSELAKELYVSAEYLSTLFSKTEGICISDYIMREKVKLAENLLIYSNHTVGEIGLYLGFCSQSHFGTVFKKYRGISPRQYRKKYSAGFSEKNET